MTAVSRSHLIDLNGPADEVLPLFGPVREAEWAEGWEPELISNLDDPTTPGTVFRTDSGDRGETLWFLAGFDAEARFVRYVRLTPATDVADITIQVNVASDHACNALITYAFTTLSPAGDEFVAGFTEDAYRHWIDEWATAINHYLETGERLEG